MRETWKRIMILVLAVLTICMISTTAFACGTGSFESDEEHKEELQHYVDLSWVTDIVIPPTVTRIEEECFYDLKIQKYTIPDSVEFIGNFALDGDWLYRTSEDFVIVGTVFF